MARGAPIRALAVAWRPAPARVLVPEVVPPERPRIPVVGASRLLRPREETTAYRAGARSWIGMLVDTYG